MSAMSGPSQVSSNDGPFGAIDVVDVDGETQPTLLRSVYLASETPAPCSPSKLLFIKAGDKLDVFIRENYYAHATVQCQDSRTDFVVVYEEGPSERINLGDKTFGLKGFPLFKAQLQVFRERCFEAYRMRAVELSMAVFPGHAHAALLRIGDHVEVYWGQDLTWNRGKATSYNPESRTFHIEYLEADEEDLHMEFEVFRFLGSSASRVYVI